MSIKTKSYITFQHIHSHIQQLYKEILKASTLNPTPMSENLRSAKANIRPGHALNHKANDSEKSPYGNWVSYGHPNPVSIGCLHFNQDKDCRRYWLSYHICVNLNYLIKPTMCDHSVLSPWIHTLDSKWRETGGSPGRVIGESLPPIQKVLEMFCVARVVMNKDVLPIAVE